VEVVIPEGVEVAGDNKSSNGDGWSRRWKWRERGEVEVIAGWWMW